MTDNFGRIRTQDDWKRTQVRMPQEQYEAIAEYAGENDLSLNSAMIELMDKGLTVAGRHATPSNIRIHRLKNGIKRVVFGKLVNSFDIDYTNPDLTELRGDIKYCLEILANTGSLRDRFMFFNKNVDVHEGDNHLDIIDDGVGSLNWLIVEDHHTQEYIDQLHGNKKPAD